MAVAWLSTAIPTWAARTATSFATPRRCRAVPRAAVRFSLLQGARVVAVAGEAFAGRLRALGAEVTAYGEGMVERVRGIVGGAPQLIFDAGPIGDVLPELVEIAGGDGAGSSQSATTARKRSA